MALTDFLSDETGASQGPGTSYVLSNKSMDWAAEMEELDIGEYEQLENLSILFNKPFL